VSFIPTEDKASFTVGRLEDVANVKGIDDPTAAYIAFTK
jgi:hypothetical protein